MFFIGPFWGAYFRRGYVRREICVSKSIALACSGKEIYHFCFVLLCIRGQIPSTRPPGGLYSERRFNGGFCALWFWGAFIWRGLYMERLIFGILRKSQMHGFHFARVLRARAMLGKQVMSRTCVVRSSALSVVSRCFAFGALITQVRIEKVFEFKTRQVYFIYPFLRRLKLVTIIAKKVCHFFFRWSWHFKREKSVFWKASFNQRRTDYASKTSRTRVYDW